MGSKILDKNFFNKNTVKVAKELLGMYLYRQTDDYIYRATIIETEAYHGEDDLACHCSKGKTERTKIMYEQSGFIYIYLIYGIYNMLNIVTMRKGFPAAVLIRGLDKAEIKTGIDKWKKIDNKTNGPGKLTKVFSIDKSLNKKLLSKETGLWIERKINYKPKKIIISKRIGIDYAKKSKELPWRFLLVE